MIKVHNSSVRLVCDGCALWAAAVRSANAAVHFARKDGWTTGKGRDLCPACTASHNAKAVAP